MQFKQHVQAQGELIGKAIGLLLVPALKRWILPRVVSSRQSGNSLYASMFQRLSICQPEKNECGHSGRGRGIAGPVMSKEDWTHSPKLRIRS